MRKPTVREAAFEQMFSSASFGTTYWCLQSDPGYVRGVRDDLGYKVRESVLISPNDESKPDFKPRRVNNYGLINAAKLCANPDVDVNMDTRKRLALWGLQVDLGYEVTVDYDAEDADCLVQLAMFGKLVYG